MSPMHRSPHDIVGIELIKQMIITAIIDQSVGIVNPTDGRCKMIDGLKVFSPPIFILFYKFVCSFFKISHKFPFFIRSLI